MRTRTILAAAVLLAAGALLGWLAAVCCLVAPVPSTFSATNAGTAWVRT